MTDEPFLLVSLEEEKAKALAQVLSNDTARRILDFLSKKDLKTETELSKELKLALSTVHYNLDLLSKTGLVSTDNFSYSIKGKQIIHYSLSNKYVIIAPKKTEALIEKLRQFLPVVLIMVFASALINYFWNPLTNLFSNNPRLMSVSPEAGLKVSVDFAEKAPLLQTQEFAIWFLFGSVFALIVYFLWAEIILKKIKKKK